MPIGVVVMGALTLMRATMSRVAAAIREADSTPKCRHRCRVGDDGVLVDAEQRHDAVILAAFRRHAEAAPQHAVPALAGGILAVERDRARVGGVEPGDDAQQFGAA